MQKHQENPDLAEQAIPIHHPNFKNQQLDARLGRKLYLASGELRNQSYVRMTCIFKVPFACLRAFSQRYKIAYQVRLTEESYNYLMDELKLEREPYESIEMVHSKFDEKCRYFRMSARNIDYQVSQPIFSPSDFSPYGRLLNRSIADSFVLECQRHHFYTNQYSTGWSNLQLSILVLLMPPSKYRKAMLHTMYTKWRKRVSKMSTRGNSHCKISMCGTLFCIFLGGVTAVHYGLKSGCTLKRIGLVTFWAPATFFLGCFL